MYRKQLSIVMVIMAGLSLIAEAVMQEKAVKNDHVVNLKIWERGIAVESTTDPPISAYLWFYEWHLFDTIRKGEHTSGTREWKWKLSPDKKTAEMKSQWLNMTARSTNDGADLLLEITKKSDHDWPEIAAMIPCFNPGPKNSRRRFSKIESTFVLTSWEMKAWCY
jgi:hypothetical protein